MDMMSAFLKTPGLHQRATDLERILLVGGQIAEKSDPNQKYGFGLVPV